MHVALSRLTEANFADYEALTSCEGGGGCYCAFWHQRITSMDEWETRRKTNPALNRQVVLDRVLTGYHVGVLAHLDGALAAWVSVGPLPEFYWAWRRVAQLGEVARTTAGILCVTLAPGNRGRGVQTEVLRTLRGYAALQGWTSVEGYPFDPSAAAQHGRGVVWPGTTKGYEEAGFTRSGAHWLSAPSAERSIYVAAVP
jgi:hypothetical protein